MNLVAFGRALRKHREEAKDSQDELASYVGCSKSHISGLENGQSAPSMQVLDKLIERYRIDPRVLFGLSSEQSEMERLANEVRLLRERYAPTDSDSSLAVKMTNKRPLREIVEMLQDYDALTLVNIKHMIMGYLTRHEEAIEADMRESEAATG